MFSSLKESVRNQGGTVVELEVDGEVVDRVKGIIDVGALLRFNIEM